MVVDVADPRGGRLRQIGIPAGGRGGEPIVPAPAVGRDTDAVLCELGYGDGDIAGLRARQVI
jgi:crotonobetainyl-CoA:carnitine CoA-transferase CaiB-like acyl-CoA transferase